MADLIKDFIHSSDLFSYPSVQKGIARTVDLFGSLDEYNTKASEEEADECELRHDWVLVGSDLSKAIKDYEQSSEWETAA